MYNFIARGNSKARNFSEAKVDDDEHVKMDLAQDGNKSTIDAKKFDDESQKT